MAEITLEPAAAIAGQELPLAVGATRLLAAQPAALVSVGPFRGQLEEASKLLRSEIGCELPDTGRYNDGEVGRILWSGHQQWFVAGNNPALAESLKRVLAGKAAVSDQSDGWTLLALIGAGARDVMARLCPLDVSAEAMPDKSVARTEFAHMMALITAIPNGFGIMVMRSFTATAVRRIRDAMASVAAQR